MLTKELGAIQDFFDDALYWYNRDGLFRLLHAIAPEEEDVFSHVQQLLALRGHPENRGEERGRFI